MARCNMFLDYPNSANFQDKATGPDLKFLLASDFYRRRYQNNADKHRNQPANMQVSIGH